MSVICDIDFNCYDLEKRLRFQQKFLSKYGVNLSQSEKDELIDKAQAEYCVHHCSLRYSGSYQSLKELFGYK